jgi:hypothetical protein
MIGSEYSIQGSYEGYLNRLVRPMMESEVTELTQVLFRLGRTPSLVRLVMGSEMHASRQLCVWFDLTYDRVRIRFRRLL